MNTVYPGTREEFLEKMEHSYDPAVFAAADGLAPEE